MTSIHWPEELIERYPLTLNHLDAETFKCGEGWRLILTQLFHTIEPLIGAMPDDDRPYIIEINETFGGLCIHTSKQVPAIAREIAKAEQLATVTCEICGAAGLLTRPKNSPAGWIRVRCTQCYESRRFV